MGKFGGLCVYGGVCTRVVLDACGPIVGRGRRDGSTFLAKLP